MVRIRIAAACYIYCDKFLSCYFAINDISETKTQFLVDRDWPVDRLKEVKVSDALKHPNWNMGKKITVDSATLFNKVSFLLLNEFILRTVRSSNSAVLL